MALSNSYNYTDTYTAANAIALALRRLGVYDPAETINSTEQTNALEVLNLLLKELSAEGVDVHLRKDAYLFITSKTKQIYTTDADYVAFSHNTTQLNGALSASATALTVDSITGIAASDIILIKLADNTMHATTVNGSPSGTTVNITTGLASAANDNAYVYSFPSTARYINKIKDILYAAALTSSSDTINDELGGYASPIELIGDTDMASRALALQNGIPRAIHHRLNPRNSELRIWPVGGVADVDRIRMVLALPIMDMDTTTDNFWLPPEGHNAVIWQLAAELAPEYGLGEAEIRRINNVANFKLTNFLDNYVEDASLIIARQ